MLLRKKHLSIRLFILMLSLVFSSSAQAADKGMIQIKGSDTMVNLGQAWSEEFMYARPEVSIAVTGGGSGTGIAAILSGTCDLAQSSRSVKEEELHKAEKMGKHIVSTTVGLDAVAVIVHPSNPVSELSIDQLSDIFTGKVTNWNEVGGQDKPILLLSRERNSGTHVFFLEEVLRKGNSKGPEEFSTAALMMPSTQSISQEVNSSESAIGYVGLGYVSPGQKVVAISRKAGEAAVMPDLKTAQTGAYPVARPLIFLTDGEPQGTIREFIDFVLSEEGQEIIRVLDFVPLKA